MSMDEFSLLRVEITQKCLWKFSFRGNHSEMSMDDFSFRGNHSEMSSMSLVLEITQKSLVFVSEMSMDEFSLRGNHSEMSMDEFSFHLEMKWISFCLSWNSLRNVYG